MVAAGTLRAGTGRARAGLMTRRVAAVDCGTNSLRLLVADVDPDRAQVTDVARRMEIVRLGQGVDSTGRLAPEALARTTGVLARLRGRHRRLRRARDPHGRDQRHQGRGQRGGVHAARHRGARRSARGPHGG